MELKYPQCAKCKKPVDELQCIRVRGDLYKLKIACHGQHNSIDLKERDLGRGLCVLFDLETDVT